MNFKPGDRVAIRTNHERVGRIIGLNKDVALINWGDKVTTATFDELVHVRPKVHATFRVGDSVRVLANNKLGRVIEINPQCGNKSISVELKSNPGSLVWYAEEELLLGSLRDEEGLHSDVLLASENERTAETPPFEGIKPVGKMAHDYLCLLISNRTDESIKEDMSELVEMSCCLAESLYLRLTSELTNDRFEAV